MTTRKKKKRAQSRNAFDPALEELLLAPIAKEMAGKPLDNALTTDSPLKQLIGRVVEMALKEEMSEHLGYSPHERREGGDTGGASNTRNGYSAKTLKTSHGKVNIDIPRDRLSTFEPRIVPKHQSISEEMEAKIVAMYTAGMSTRDIERHVAEMYGIDSSAMLVSRLTQKLDEELTQWRNRPLEAMYPVVFVDAMHVPVRHAHGVISTAVYQVCAYNEYGKLEIIGLYMSTTEAGRKESSSYWHHVLIELEKRGLKDILILCADGLNGLEDAARAVYPEVQFQPCVVHLVRASTRLISWKDRSAVCNALKRIYAAPSYEAAEVGLSKLEEEWGNRYPGVVDQWQRNLPRLSSLWSYSEPLRKMVYTTNAIENVNRQARKTMKNRASMPNVDAALRLMSLAMRDLNRRHTKKSQGRGDWRRIVTELPLHFGERIPINWGHRLQAWQ